MLHACATFDKHAIVEGAISQEHITTAQAQSSSLIEHVNLHSFMRGMRKN